MDWSSIWKRAPRRRRQAVLTAEPLEGRALLSAFAFARERPGMRIMAERLALHRGGRHLAPSPTTTPSGTSSAPATTGDPSGGTAPASQPTTATPPTTTAASPTTTPTATAPTATAPMARLAPGGFALSGGFGTARDFARGRGFGMGGFGGGMMAPMQGGGGTGSAAMPTDPRIAALQQYQADVKTIYDKSQVTPALQAALTNDLQAIAKAATTAPDRTKVLAFQSDLSSLAGTLPTAAQLTNLQADLSAVATSEGVTDATKVSQTFTDLDALIAATNITATDVTTLSNDLKAAGLSTVAPLVAPLGVNLEVLTLAVNYHPATTTTTPATATSTS